jgi:predicted enzyme related to lactoylglutathione lyase
MVSMPHPVVHWEIAAANSEQLRDFYGQLFDWNIQVDPSLNYGMVDTGGGGINGGIFSTGDQMPPYVTFYVAVDDLPTYLEKAESLGGKTVVPPTEIPNIGHFAMFSDPSGNTIGLFKGG